MKVVSRPRSAGRGSLDPGQRPWPGIAGPWCEYCSWAYRGWWPSGRMEVKFLNAMCPRHRMPIPYLPGEEDR